VLYIPFREATPTMAFLDREQFQSRPDYGGIVHRHAFAELAGAGLSWMNTPMSLSRFLASGLLVLLFSQAHAQPPDSGR
jgi:hypothetical protein